jgi:integrase
MSSQNSPSQNSNVYNWSLRPLQLSHYNFRVRRFNSSVDGDMAILIEQSSGPVFWANYYVMSQYFKSGKAISTCEKLLRILGMARMWCHSTGRDLDVELQSGNFLSVEDIEQLADFLCYKAHAQKIIAESYIHSKKHFHKVSSLEQYRSRKQQQFSSSDLISDANEKATRIRWVAKYIKWHLDRRLGELDRLRQDVNDLRECGRIIIERLKALAPKTSQNNDDELHLEGMTDEVICNVENILQPDSIRNPFRCQFVKHRNYLIWRLLLDTGARRHEIHASDVENIEYSTKRLNITESKTFGRTVPISSLTADVFDNFITQFWSKLPRSTRKNQHLFTNKKGKRLSIRAFNRIFEKVRSIEPNIPNYFAPHSIRRTWNDNFSKAIDSVPIGQRKNKNEEIEMRNRLQGWSGSSSMGMKYAKRHLRKASDEMAEKLTEQLVKQINKDGSND